MLEQLVDWEHAGSLLEQAAANTERLQAELALCCTESDAASAAHSKAISDQQKITENVKRASLENISLSSSRKAETMAREHHMILEEHAANGAKEEAQAVQILISERADTQ